MFDNLSKTKQVALAAAAVILVLVVLSAAFGHASAATIDRLTGCEIKPIVNSNAWQFVDVACAEEAFTRLGFENKDDPRVELDEEEGGSPGLGK